MEYTITRLKESEYPLMEEFLYQAIYLPAGTEPPDRAILNLPQLQVYIRDFGSCPDDHALAARVNGAAAGLVWTRIMDDYGHVSSTVPSLAISLLPQYRNQGIGSALMKQMLAHLEKLGYRHVSLSVQKSNYAFPWYKSMGFTTVRENEEEAVMIRRLNTDL